MKVIVGQGLAGSLLAFRFLQKKKDFIVIDSPSYKSGKFINSSVVAGGLFSPISGKRNNKTWMFDEFFRCSQQTFEELENLLGIKLLFPKKTFRTLDTNKDIDEQFKKAKLEFSTLIPSLSFCHLNQHPGFEIFGSGYLDTQLFISSFRNYLQSQNRIIFNPSNPQEILKQFSKNLQNQVIYCEGWKASNNPIWKWLPFKLSKGEILTIHCPDLELQGNIFSSNHLWIFPIEGNIFKIGSTFEWNDLNEETTENSKKILLERFHLLFPKVNQVKVLSQEAGIRPTVLDTKPLLGIHPKFSNCFIFNGLGTKGVLMAPLLSEMMCNYLEDGIMLSNEVGIKRFIIHYNSK